MKIIRIFYTGAFEFPCDSGKLLSNIGNEQFLPLCIISSDSITTFGWQGLVRMSGLLPGDLRMVKWREGRVAACLYSEEDAPLLLSGIVGRSSSCSEDEKKRGTKLTHCVQYELWPKYNVITEQCDFTGALQKWFWKTRLTPGSYGLWPTYNVWDQGR